VLARRIVPAFINAAGFSQVRSIQRSFALGGQVETTRYSDFAQGGTWQTVSKIGFDARGMPSTIGISVDGGTTFPTTVTQTRNVAGLVTKRAANLATGSVESNFTYDKLGRVGDQTIQKVSPAAAVSRQTLTYTGNDSPKTLQHFLGSTSKTFTYGYDPRHQLTNVTTDTASYFGAVYQYGVAGRFTAAKETRTGTAPSGTDLLPRDVNYVYGGADAEQVTALTLVSTGARFATFTYDDAGNMLTRCMGATYTPTCTGELLAYTYDGKDQLRRVVRKVNNAVTGSEEYWYDADGNRTHVRKLDAAGATTELVWYLDETEHHITPPPTQAEPRAYAHVTLGTPVARIDRTSDFTTALELQFHGLANNTLATVDKATGTINASFTYAPFGEVLEATNAGGTTSGTATHKRRFNDEVQDEVSGLTYYGALLRQGADRLDAGRSEVPLRARRCVDDASPCVLLHVHGEQPAAVPRPGRSRLLRGLRHAALGELAIHAEAQRARLRDEARCGRPQGRQRQLGPAHRHHPCRGDRSAHGAAHRHRKGDQRLVPLRQADRARLRHRRRARSPDLSRLLERRRKKATRQQGRRRAAPVHGEQSGSVGSIRQSGSLLGCWLRARVTVRSGRPCADGRVA
jgi:hypothetical protein